MHAIHTTGPAPIVRSKAGAWRRRAAAAAALASLVVAAPAWSAAITFAAVDLPDVTVGVDVWRYDYTVTGPIGAFESFNLLFSPASYGPFISYTNSAPADIDVAPLVNPDPLLPADGLLSITAVPNALGGGFSAQVSVMFQWIGSGTPDAQPWEYVDANFNVLSTQRTQPAGGGGGGGTPVPEPASGWLLIGALGALAAASRRGAAHGR